MRKIGLLGGMSFEGSASYYRLINEEVRQRLGGLNSADLILRSVNFDAIVQLQKADRWDEIGRTLGKAAQELQRSGADCLLVCAVTMHLVADEVEAAVDVPFIHVVDETARSLNMAGRRKPLLLATRYTMEDGFYQARMALHGLEIVVPDVAARAAVHAIIFDELAQGIISDRSRETLVRIIEAAKAEEADSVIFGCTEIGLILKPDDLPLPGFDSTVIHASAAVAFALGEGAAVTA